MIFIEERPTEKMPGLTSFFISFKYNQQIIDIIKLLDVKDYNKQTTEWEIPITALSQLIDMLTCYDDIEIKFIKQNNTEIKPIDLDISDYKLKPYNYQIEAIKYGLTHNKWLLLDMMGLGKTLTALHIAEELKQREGIKHCLIICGVNNLKFNWKKEVEKHTYQDCLILGQKINSKGKLVIGSVKDRLDQLKAPIKEFFIITNIETLRDDSIAKQLSMMQDEIDMIVVDELHCAKSSTSEQGKHLLKLKAKYMLGMTGTLLLNNPLDVFVPLKWIGVEKSTLTNFKLHYCTYVGQFHNILIGFKHLDLLKYELSQYSLRRTKDILDLPEKTIIPEIVEMDSRQAAFYENIKQGIVDEVDKVNMSTASLLSMVARLRQATAAPSILTTENIQSAKIIRACELARDIVESGNKVVIFSTFKEPVYLLQELLSDLNPLIGTGDIKDDIISDNIDKFQNNPDLKVFIGTFAKCSTGITLTAATYMICIDSCWTAAQNNQAEDRIHRIGSKNPVFIYYLITKDTIDEHVQDIVNDKKALSDFIIDNKISDRIIDNLKKYIEDLKI